MKPRTPASTRKKVVVRTLDNDDIHGYVNPSGLGRGESFDLLTIDGEHQPIPLSAVKAVYFVRQFTDGFEPQRKAFLSRPKLDGLWVRLRFRDGDSIEGIVANNLLEMLDHGVVITPPDLQGESLKMFIPRSALAEMTVLGVVGVSRRKPAATAPAQRALFNE